MLPAMPSKTRTGQSLLSPRQRKRWRFPSIRRPEGAPFIIVGNEDWPMPVPLAKTGNKWYFDTKAGKQELLYRRIGSNELDAIQICRGYVDAQEEYALKPREGYNVNQYAQRIVSTPGTQDGLAWKNADGTWGGPIGENIADAIVQGYSSKEQPYHGYFFKILKGSGAGRAARTAGLRDQRRDDRGVRDGCGPGAIPRDGREDLHRQQ